MFIKNTAGQFIHFQGVDVTTGGIKSGVTWTVRRCIDGTFAAGTGTVTEDGTTGWYKYAMSQADTNGNNIGFNFTGTGAIPQTVNIVTTVLNPYDAVRFGMTALPNAAAEAAGGLYTRGTGAGQINQAANGMVDTNTVNWKGATAPAMTGDAYARLGAPAGASVSADIAAVKGDSGAVKTQTDKMAFSVTNQIDANVIDWKGAVAPAMTGDAYASIGAAGAGLTALGDTRIANLDAAVSTRATPADVNAQVLDVLNTDTFAEPGQEAPPATTTLIKKIGYLYKLAINKITQDSTTLKVYNNAGTIVDQKASASDNGSLFTRDGIGSGP